MQAIGPGGARRAAGRLLAAAAIGLCCTGAQIPSNVRMLTSDRVLTFTTDGRTISAATLCPGYQFDQLGTGGPVFSPDRHWVLVDVLGQFTPGNVARNHALVSVATGGLVLAPDFPRYAGIPMTLDPLTWASGQRATLRYKNGQAKPVRDPPPLPYPLASCPPARHA